MSRQLTPYEQTQLRRFGKSGIKLAQYGEMPIEYVTGWVEFLGRVFQIDDRALIPRVETEELVELVLRNLAKLPNNQSSIQLAEVGTGCGAVGLSLALELELKAQPAQLYLSDVSEQAVELAKQNRRRLGLTDQVKIIVSDLLTNYPTKIFFDVIVANLPYIPSGRIAYLDKSVKDYEPRLALDGGQDGLELIKQLINQAKSRLKPRGKVYLEVDYTHGADDFREFFDSFEVQMIKDSFNRQRFAVLTLATNTNLGD